MQEKEFDIELSYTLNYSVKTKAKSKEEARQKAFKLLENDSEDFLIGGGGYVNDSIEESSEQE